MSENNSDSDDDYDYDYDNSMFELHMDEDYVCEDDENTDIESLKHHTLSITEVEDKINTLVNSINTFSNLPLSTCRVLLFLKNWDVSLIKTEYLNDSQEFLKSCNLLAPISNISPPDICPICYKTTQAIKAYPECGHSFCTKCWTSYFTEMIESQGKTIDIECAICPIILRSDFVKSFLSDSAVYEKFSKLEFIALVKSNPQLTCCPTSSCNNIIEALEPPKSKSVFCKACGVFFCFLCQNEPHMPSSCYIINLWLKKCHDDSETARYISVHTKPCPKCWTSIEKNGGCNHMNCTRCKEDFCWMCLGPWSTHNLEYYNCSKFKEENVPKDAEATRAALNKYLHFYSRWDNHNRSLQMEEEYKDKIQKRRDEKINAHKGTYIDWSGLMDACNILIKSRHTLKNSYAHAYYLEPGTIKDLFEMRQAKLEVAAEDLAWKLEHIELEDRGSLKQQSDIVEKMRLLLLE